MDADEFIPGPDGDIVCVNRTHYTADEVRAMIQRAVLEGTANLMQELAQHQESCRTITFDGKWPPNWHDVPEGHNTTTVADAAAVGHLIRRAVLTEREACAKLAEDRYDMGAHMLAGFRIAAAIRARV